MNIQLGFRIINSFKLPEVDAEDEKYGGLCFFLRGCDPENDQILSRLSKGAPAKITLFPEFGSDGQKISKHF